MVYTYKKHLVLIYSSWPVTNNNYYVSLKIKQSKKQKLSQNHHNIIWYPTVIGFDVIKNQNKYNEKAAEIIK